MLISRGLTSAAAQEQRAEPWTRLVRGDSVAVWNADTVGGDPPPSTEVTVQLVLDPPQKVVNGSIESDDGVGLSR